MKKDKKKLALNTVVVKQLVTDLNEAELQGVGGGLFAQTDNCAPKTLTCPGTGTC